MQIRSLIAAVLLGAALCGPLGCKNPEQAALVATTSANGAGDLAASGYLAYCAANKIDPASHPDIVQAARGFKAAKEAAKVAIVTWKSTQTADAQAKMQAALGATAAAESQLIALVRAFNPNLVK